MLDNKNEVKSTPTQKPELTKGERRKLKLDSVAKLVKQYYESIGREYDEETEARINAAIDSFNNTPTNGLIARLLKIYTVQPNPAHETVVYNTVNQLLGIDRDVSEDFPVLARKIFIRLSGDLEA